MGTVSDMARLRRMADRLLRVHVDVEESFPKNGRETGS